MGGEAGRQVFCLHASVRRYLLSPSIVMLISLTGAAK